VEPALRLVGHTRAAVAVNRRNLDRCRCATRPYRK